VAVPEERLENIEAFDWEAMSSPRSKAPPDEALPIDAGTEELLLNLYQ
jgi:hypothetical protein